MAYEGLNWQVINLPFRAGLMQKADDRARPQPFLDIAKDIQFDELGGVQTRLPLTTMSNSIFGGGTLSNCRRLAVVNDELCVFTDTGLYSYNEQLTKWILRATHLAVDIDERTASATPGDQFDCDRAELNGTVMFAWVEGSTSFISAFDKTTGATLMPQTSLGAGIVRPRLVAASTKILGFALSGTTLLYAVIDPANPAAAVFNTMFTSVPGPYDVTRIEGQDGVAGAYQRTVTTSYTVFTVNAAGTVTSSTKARTCDGPIAVATTPSTGLEIQVIRANGTNIQGDLITTSTLADVASGQAVGTAASTAINQIAVSLASASVVRAFWTSGNVGETTGVTDFEVKTNTVTSGVPGTQATFRHRLGIASRAFTYAGHVYIWLVFAQDSGVSVTGNTSAVRAQLQNTYFLYRDDNFIVSQCTRNVGGGFAPTTGRLPGVALTSGSTAFSWCATVRRRIELGTGEDHSAFGARSPRDVTFTFDSDAARRTGRIGRTMYITGGIPLQYDGVQTAEVGFLNYPWYFEPAVGGAGAIAAGTYTWQATYRWLNAQGEVDRSTTATGMTLTIAANKFVFLNFFYLNTTLKIGARRPAIDMWRTTLVTAGDQPFYLATSQDPTALPGANNGYVINDDTLDSAGAPLPDNFTDAILQTKEKHPENGPVFEYTAPPGARLITETDTRLYLGGVPGDPDRVFPSRLRLPGEVASFHEDLAVQIPRPGGAMTALAIHQETPTVFRETAIYRLLGQGLSNTNQGSNLEAIDVPGGVGAVNQESVAKVGSLGTIFKSRKGWYLLTPGWSVQYIGAQVSDYDSETVKAVTVLETQHQVRILSGSRMIVWDYSAVTEESPLGQWFEWTVTTGVDAVNWRGSYVVLTATGPAIQSASYSSLTYGLDVETASIKLADLQGAAAVRKLEILGEYRSAFLLWIRIAYNYKQSGSTPTYVDSKIWTPSPTTVGGPLQVKHGPKFPRCQSIKVRLTAVTDAARALLLADLSGPLVISTDSTRWSATLQAVAPGELGNLVTLSIAFVDGTPTSIDVRDHFVYASGAWTAALNTIGVLVTMSSGSRPTIGQLEAAITAGTALATVAIADTPTKIIAASMIGTTKSDVLAGGAFGSPTGEALKLTGIALEVGYERGLNRYLPSAQQQ
ncbi:MAG: hypothetical protein ACM358_11880 [Gemmatimonadota bacterium]